MVISVNLFKSVMQPLLKHLGVDATLLADVNTYEVTLQDLTVTLSGASAEQLVIAVNLGPCEPDTNIAWQLLEMNLFGDSLPALQISAVAQHRTVILWTQERLMHLSAPILIALFERFVDTALQLREVLRKPQSAAPAPRPPREQGPALNSFQSRLALEP